MTCDEFSNEFDVLLDSYRRFKGYDSQEMLDSIEFNEYEKSVFLTKAQEQLVISLYNGKNPFNDSFEKTEEIRTYLASLIKTYTKVQEIEEIVEDQHSLVKVAPGDIQTYYQLPDDLLFIIYESVVFHSDDDNCIEGKAASVIPVTYDTYYRISQNPFRQQNDRRVLRIDIMSEPTLRRVALISKNQIGSYNVTYLKRPCPIVLQDIDNTRNNLTIQGINKKTECEINPALHNIILESAVQMALASVSVTGDKNSDNDKK